MFRYSTVHIKVKMFDRLVVKSFLEKVSIVSAIFSIVFIFVKIPIKYEYHALASVVLFFVFFYIYLWFRLNSLKDISIVIEGSEVNIKTGDIFKQSGFKAIAFNEYFDTQVDNIIISERSLNGVFIKENSSKSVEELNAHIDNYQYDDSDLIDGNVEKSGKTKRYKLGTICILDDYLLVAFSKFDTQNKANLTMPEYLEFLINFWDNVNRVYSQQDVSVPIFGSGITRIKEHKNISDEELLKIMLWTFRISEMRFKYPARLSIIIHKDKINSINLLEIQSIN